jgi:hypothetical protein
MRKSFLRDEFFCTRSLLNVFFGSTVNKTQQYLQIFFVHFFGGLECVGHSCAYVAHFVFWEMSEAESKEKHDVWDSYAVVDYNLTLSLPQSQLHHIYHRQPYAMHESTLTLCQSRLYPPVKGLRIWPLDSNPESCRSKQARYQLCNPSPSNLSHTSPYLATHLPT